METSVEHVRQLWPASPEVHVGQERNDTWEFSGAALADWRGAAGLSVQAKQPSSAVRHALVAAAATTGVALIRHRWSTLAVQATRSLLQLGLGDFARDVVIHAASQGHAGAAGVLCVAAAQHGATQAVHRLYEALLSGRNVGAAAAVAEAYWHVAAAAGWAPRTAAKLLAPPVVAAVDRGQAGTVARVFHLLFSAHAQPLLLWLLEAVVRDAERPDAAAAIAWEALKQDNGAEMLADVWALLAVDGHHSTAAQLAWALHEHQPERGKEQQLAEVLAAATQAAIDAGRVSDAVAVHWLLFEEGQLELLTDMLAALSQRQPGGPHSAGLLCSHAVIKGRAALVAATCRELLLLGRPRETAAVLTELYATGRPHQASRVAAAALVDAVDGGAAAEVAATQMLLWQAGQLPLLRDMQLAFARAGWGDAAAEVAWQLLQQGGVGALAGLLAALLSQGAAEEAAELGCHLARLANNHPSAGQAFGEALLSSVRAGAASHAARMAAQLQRGGARQLLAGALEHLNGSGRQWERARLAEAASQLEYHLPDKMQHS